MWMLFTSNHHKNIPYAYTMPLTVGLTAVCDLKSTESVTFLHVHLTCRGGYIASVTSLGEPVPVGKNDEIFFI